MTRDKIKRILDILNTIQEDLLSLPDDMLLNIDPRDNDSLIEGVEFITAFNNNLDQFTDSASKIEGQIKKYFSINPEEEEIEKESINTEKRERIIKELDQSAPHSLEENFTYKRPYGFILEDAAFKGIKTWKNLYFNLLEYLKDKDTEKFARLPKEDQFISKRGNRLFSENEKDLRYAEPFAGFYVERNLSANHIRDNIKKILEYFHIAPKKMKIYFREDRDAERRD